MKRAIGITLALQLLATSLASDALAQWNVARFAAERNHVYTSFGLDPALVATLGYGRVVDVLGHDFQLTGEAGMVTAELDTHDFRARLGTQTSLLHWRALRVTGSATFITRGTSNVIYDGLNFGADLTGTVGAYRRNWFAAGEFGFDKAIITHVTHTDWYRTHYYAQAKDGWYLDTGGTYHYGVTGGVALGRTELLVRAGWHRTERYNDLLTPVYASVGLGIGF